MVSEEGSVNTLKSTFRVSGGSFFLVISDTTIEELPILCRNSNCTSKAQLWIDKSPTFFDSGTTIAFVDFVLACKMQTFLGNVSSTFCLL